MKKYRVAVIGAGAIGLTHIQGFQQSPHADVVAVAEKSPDRGQEAVQKFGVPDLHENYKDVLRRKDIDVVSIALPNYLHASVAIESLQAGKHVMLDKPMATNAKDAAKILVAAKKAKKVFMVGQNMRFRPDTQTLKEAVQNGTLGHVHHLQAYWLRRSGIPRIGSWFTQKKFAGGGTCYDIGVHLLDLSFYLIDEFQVVSVSGSTTGHLGSKGIGDGGWGKSEIDPRKIFDVDDRAIAFLKLKSGRTVYLEVTWATFQEEEDRVGVELFGDKAGAKWYPVKIFRKDHSSYVTEQLKPGKMIYPTERMVHFMDCVANKKKPLVKPEQSFHVQKVLDAIYKSSKTGKEVRIA
jgi:predicted dehydrogenase